MHYLTIIGVILIFTGTILTYYGQQLKSDESNKSLINTITSKDQKIDTLSSEIAALKSEADTRNENRKTKIKTVAGRANRIFSESESFYQGYLSRHGKSELVNLLTKDLSESKLTKGDIIKSVNEVFISSSMLTDSNAKRLDGTPISEVEYFYTQMTKVYTEANSILEHYGDIDHLLIKQIDEIRSRSKMFIEMIPLLKSSEGGIEAVFGEKVMEQWADFISHFYYTQYECHRTSIKILSE
jgi:hypothetical protein